MKIPQFYITVVLGCALRRVEYRFDPHHQEQPEPPGPQFQAQQEEINKGELTSKVGQNLLARNRRAFAQEPKIAEVLKSKRLHGERHPFGPATPSATPTMNESIETTTSRRRALSCRFSWLN